MKDLGPIAREALRQMNENLRAIKRVAKVLVVDDSHSDCLLLEHELKAFDPSMEVHFAKSEQEAIEACANTRFDVIFLDLIFPQGAGAKMLKSEWVKSADHIVVLTGADAGSIPVEEARKAGAKVILPKPVESETLGLIFGRIPSYGKKRL